MSASAAAAQPPALPDLHEEPAATPSPLESVYDVPIRISAVLGKTKMSVADLLRLSDGAVIELDRKVGEPIDLYVNDRLVARGELIMIDGSLGVTMTEIVRDDL
jgi:flagellar motor switch protein FliN/FliY